MMLPSLLLLVFLSFTSLHSCSINLLWCCTTVLAMLMQLYWCCHLIVIYYYEFPLMLWPLVTSLLHYTTVSSMLILPQLLHYAFLLMLFVQGSWSLFTAQPCCQTLMLLCSLLLCLLFETATVISAVPQPVFANADGCCCTFWFFFSPSVVGCVAPYCLALQCCCCWCCLHIFSSVICHHLTCCATVTATTFLLPFCLSINDRLHPGQFTLMVIIYGCIFLWLFMCSIPLQHLGEAAS